jgi:hypothetical protein
MIVYVGYREWDYEGCSSPISVHFTLESAQAFFGDAKTWMGPSADREWSSRVSSGEYVSIAEMRVEE